MEDPARFPRPTFEHPQAPFPREGHNKRGGGEQAPGDQLAKLISLSHEVDHLPTIPRQRHAQSRGGPGRASPRAAGARENDSPGSAQRGQIESPPI
eukprot:5259027-Pyramimonas_sp.AAC.1